jgi:rRNA maturation RNase YbeY
MAIQYSSFQTTFKLSNPKKTSAWIERVVKTEGSAIESLAYVFCNDKYLLGINQEYLNHDTLTDIITFDYRENTRAKSKPIDGEIYISIPRIRENARSLDVDFDTELHRVIIHGVLHLLGYKDKTASDKLRMRKKEGEYLEARG